MKTIFVFVLAILLEIVDGEGCFHFINKTEGKVSSPNYPLPYPNNLTCTWEFKTIPERIFKVVFDFFELESEEKCLYDYVEFYDGEKILSKSLGRFCGMNAPPSVTSTTPRMLMIFHSDGSFQLKGFTASYSSDYYFTGINTTEIKEVEEILTQYLLNPRKQYPNAVNKWGTNVARTAVALYLINEDFFDNEAGEEIVYELTLQLMSKMVMKKRISTKDLAHFVNAMTVACLNPWNFFGPGVIDELRQRVDNSNLTNPYFILTLCNAGEVMKMEYIDRLEQLFDVHSRPSWTDTQAMVVLALKCISEKLNINLNPTLMEMVIELKGKQQDDGTMENLGNTALVIQALMATDSFETDFNLSMAIKSILKEVKQSQTISIEEIFYILPIFKYRTLLNINSSHCENFIKTDLEEINGLPHHPDEQIQIQVSIVVGDNTDFSSTRKIKVPVASSFYQVLETISTSEPEFRVRYKIVDEKPYVASVGNFKDSTADGLFWFIYTKPLYVTHDPVFVEKSPVDIQVNETEEVILWYRSLKQNGAEKPATTNELS